MCTPLQCEDASAPNDVDCTPTFTAALTGCDDGEPATHDDVCNGYGLCIGQTYDCTVAQCEDSSVVNGSDCTVVFDASGTPCDDGDDASGGDTCNGEGVCSGTAIVCPLDQCTLTVTPDGEGGVPTFQVDGPACDDADSATHDDSCDGAGICAGTLAVCAPSQCQATSAPDGSGGCSATLKAAGPVCNDGELTTQADQCDGQGACPGTAYTCSAGPCTATSIPNGTDCDLTWKPAQTPCDDGLLITATDVCDGAGECAGTPYTCSPSGDCELEGTPNGVGCNLAYKGVGIDCNDGDSGTLDDVCDGLGSCGGTAYTCDATQCQASSIPNGIDCDITHKSNDTACDDSNVHTKTDVCDGSGGCAGAPYTCSPNQCELSSSANGVDCTVTYQVGGIPCDDGDEAMAGDECKGDGTCRGFPVSAGENCAAALPINVGSVYEEGTSAAGFTNSYTAGTNLTCSALGGSTPGPDVVYQLSLTPGQAYYAKLFSTFDGALYVLGADGDTCTAFCLGGADATSGSGIEEVNFTATSSTMYVVIDSAGASGTFSIFVEFGSI